MPARGGDPYALPEIASWGDDESLAFLVGAQALYGMLADRPLDDQLRFTVRPPEPYLLGNDRIEVPPKDPTITIDSELLDLTTIEHRILVALGKERDTVVSNQRLVETVWEHEYAPRLQRQLYIQVRNLRCQLDTKAPGIGPATIKSKYGAGYYALSTLQPTASQLPNRPKGLRRSPLDFPADSMLSINTHRPQLRRLAEIAVVDGHFQTTVEALQASIQGNILPDPDNHIVFQVAGSVGSCNAGATAMLDLNNGKIAIDTVGRVVWVSGKLVAFGQLEYAVLELVAHNADHVVPWSRLEELAKEVTGSAVEPYKQVKNCMWRLRQKLGEQGKVIQKTRGVGYVALSGRADETIAYPQGA